MKHVFWAKCIYFLGRQPNHWGNRTEADGVYTRAKLGISHVLHKAVGMQQKTSTFNNNNLTQLLSQRLTLWDQQDAAQRDGAFHQALSLERRIRQLTDDIRTAMALEAIAAGPGR